MAVIGTGTDVWVLSTEADVIEGWMYVREIKWTGASTGGDDVKVMDYDSGTVLLEGTAPQYAGLDVVFSQPTGKAINGIKVTTLDSGAVYVYLA